MENNNNINCNSSTMLLENNNNNGLLYPMMMIQSLSHQHQTNHNNNNNNSHHHHNNNNSNKLCCSLASCSSTAAAAAAAAAAGCYDHIMEFETRQHQLSHNNNININSSSNNNNNCSIKAQIMSHPHYPRLLSAFVKCQKVGAPPEVVARLEEAEAMSGSGGGGGGGRYIGEDPGLDQFMEAYCEMLTKYEEELSKPFKEAMIFLSRIESQFKTLTLSSSTTNSPSSDLVPVACAEIGDRSGSSDEDIDVNNNLIDPSAEDRELKGQLLRKYSGYLGSLRQEFLKKRKKGKLPKEARQQLLEWWSRHYKWPYPSESQKLALAEVTGLDQKQINNWFINQRKRHWKPSEDMQFMVMDAATATAAAHHPHYNNYMETVLGNPFPMDVSQTLM